jgi:hypothetical protein
MPLALMQLVLGLGQPMSLGYLPIANFLIFIPVFAVFFFFFFLSNAIYYIFIPQLLYNTDMTTRSNG